MATPIEPGPDVRRLSADDLYWEEVEAARGRTLEQKVLAGPQLFDLSCEFMRAGIRMQHPTATAVDVERILRERLEIGRGLETRP